MKKKICILAFCFLAFAVPLSGNETDAKKNLVSAKDDLEAGRYSEAVKKLSVASDDFPVIGDYIFFWLARAYHGTGDIKNSDKNIKELLKAYPDTPLKKKARSFEIRNMIPSEHTPDNLKLFEAYIKDYPEDYEIKFIHAQALKTLGDHAGAKEVFKNIYVNADDILSRMAFSELLPEGITAENLIDKASNLMSRLDFQEAENLLREALQKAGNEIRPEAMKKLGHALFRQRKYKEAAEFYKKADELFHTARALYRAGDNQEFEDSLKKLMSSGDAKTGQLLLMKALEKRRNNKMDEALRIYKEVAAKYLSEKESALWSIAWTYYRKEEYRKAADVLTELYNLYGSSKYLYWKAKSFEQLGRDTEDIYKQLSKVERDFYGTLALMKTGTEFLQNDAIKTAGQEKAAFNLLDSALSERHDLLIELGMKKEAVSELAAIVRKSSDTSEILNVFNKMQEAGEYRLPMILSIKISDKNSVRKIQYPLAHWEIVMEAAAKYNIDPFIVISLMREESRFDPEARSSVGAAGLMQLMPQTAYNVGNKLDMKITSLWQIYDVKTNITLGSYYISSLMKEFNSLHLAAAAYNAGEQNVRKWQKAGNYKSSAEFIEDIPFDETRNFVKRVITTYFEYFKASDRKNNMPKIL